MRKRKLLNEKNAEIKKIQLRYDSTSARYEENVRKANNLRKQLADCSKIFGETVANTRRTALKTNANTKAVNSRYTTGEMESLRGYSCKSKGPFGGAGGAGAGRSKLAGIAEKGYGF